MITRSQREALWAVYCRRFQDVRPYDRRSGQTYLQFRRSVHPLPSGPAGCIMVRWAGMWLGIETDGYTHS